MRRLYPFILLCLLFAACGRTEDDVQCLPPPPESLLRFRMMDGGFQDMLKNGGGGIRFMQPCRTDTLIPVYSTVIRTGTNDVVTVVGFKNLIFPYWNGVEPGIANNPCKQLRIVHPSGDEDTVTWAYSRYPIESCGTVQIDEVLFNGIMTPRDSGPTADNRIYVLIKP